MVSEFRYLKSVEEMVSNINNAMCYSEPESLCLGKVRRGKVSFLDKFGFKFMKTDIEVEEVTAFELLRIKELAFPSRFGEYESVGRIDVEVGRESGGYYERLAMSGNEGWILGEKELPCFEREIFTSSFNDGFGFGAGRFFGLKGGSDFLVQKLFPNDFFVKGQYLNKINK